MAQRQGTTQDGRIDMPDLVLSIESDVSPARIYAVLADLPTHTTWAGSMHRKKNFGLRSLDAPEGPARVGTEFTSTGIDPMGSFSDRSVVTEATSPSVFEFVTEGHLDPKKASKPSSELRTTYRFEIADRGAGSTITYRVHLSRWTNAPAMLRVGILRPITRAVLKSYAKRLLRNLSTYAADR
jgi:hypothetical protein